MVGIAFYFEENDKDVYSGRRIDLDAWNYAIKLAGDVDEVIIVNKTDTILRSPDHDLKSFNVVDELPELSGVVAHVVCPWDKKPQQKVPLWKCNHNVDWYVFGPAAGWDATQEIISLGVFIPQNGIGALHAVHAATVIMAHRFGVLSWQLQ